MSTIQDTLTYADGSLANGRLVVTWKPFTVNNSNVGGGELEYEIVDGNVTVTLYSNANAQPLGSYYTAKYELENGAVYNEYWIIPSLQTVTLGQVRVSFPPTPSVMISPLQLTSLNGQPGMFLMWDGTHWVPSYPTIANFPGASQTPWISNIEGAGFQLNNAGGIGIGAPADAPAVGVYVQSTPTGGAVYGLMHVSKNPNGAASVYLQSDVNYTFVMALYSSQGGINQNRARLDSTGVDMIFGTGSAANNLADRVHITQAGLVGVGRIPTAYPLEVAGDLNLVGGVYRVDGVPFALAPDSSVQQLQFALAGVLKSTRHQLNFVAGSGVNLNLVDDSPNNQGTLTITAVSTGAPSPSIFSVNGTQIGTQPELNLIASTGVTLGGVNNTGAGRVDITVTSSVTGGVTSVFTRTGAVAADALDYSAFYPSLSGSYVNPAWIISIPWSKITGAPSTAQISQIQTPWLSNIDGASHNLSGVGQAGMAGLSVAANANALIRTPFINTNTGASSRMDLAIGASWGGTGSTIFIGSSNNAYGQAETSYIDVQAGNLLINGAVVHFASSVGIGTGAPRVALDCRALGVAVGGVQLGLAQFVKADATQKGVVFGYDDSGQIGTIGAQTASAASQLSFHTFDGSAWGERMRITGAGLVGIGRIPTNFPLEVAGPIVSVEQANYWATIGMDPGGTPAGVSNFSHFYDGNINMGRIEAITSGSSWRSINACGRGGSFTVGTTFTVGYTPIALCDFSSDVAGPVDILMIRSGITAGGHGPAMVFGQNSGSALQCKWQASYNGNTNGMDLAFWAYNNAPAVEKVRFTSGGSICVGTPTATGRITVIPPGTTPTIASANQISIGEGSDNPSYRLNIGFASFIGGSGWAGVLQTSPGGVPLCLNPSGGNVAVNKGTTAASWALDITGDCNVTGAFRVNGAAIAAGGITTRSIATGSRAQGTVYQNTVGKPMFVCVTSLINANSYMQLLTDGSNPPSTIASAMTNSSTSIQATMTISGWVMPGEFYKAFSSGGTLSTWIEWW